MSDFRPAGPVDEGDRLPWLEPVEEEGQGPSSAPSTGKVLGLVLLGLVVLGLIVGGYSWFSRPEATEGKGELIAAPEGPYKVKPDDPGGMEVQGKGDTAFAASAGEEPQGRIDMTAVPEAPVAAARPKAKAPVQPVANPPEEASDLIQSGQRLQTGDDNIVPEARGGTLQLGAFSSQASANSAWKALSDRFRYLEPLTHSVIPVQSGGRTLYRLRASGLGAADICRRLQVAGETCVRVN